jgi:hypothetical protein
MGPTFLNTSFSSAGLVMGLMLGMIPAIGNVAFPLVDVRDTAIAHVKAAMTPGLKGERIAIC